MQEEKSWVCMKPRLQMGRPWEQGREKCLQDPGLLGWAMLGALQPDCIPGEGPGSEPGRALGLQQAALRHCLRPDVVTPT